VTPRLLDIIAGFAGGVITHFIAHWLIVYVSSGRVLRNSLSVFARRQGLRRLRIVLRKKGLDPNDAYAVVRAEWACALYDLSSEKHASVMTAIQALSSMADMLRSEEKDVAHEALRLRYATNQNRSIDREYLKALQALTSIA
jgi:hypothetical protein